MGNRSVFQGGKTIPDDLKALLGDAAAQVMEAIELRVQRFFVQALQLDPRTMRLEASLFNRLRTIYTQKRTSKL